MTDLSYLINKFGIAPKEIDEFLKGWATEAEKFKRQPGYISTQLHRGIGESGTFINYAVWESVKHFKKAVTNVIDPKDPDSAFPPSTTVSPHCSRKLQFQVSAYNNFSLEAYATYISLRCYLFLVSYFRDRLISLGNIFVMP